MCKLGGEAYSHVATGRPALAATRLLQRVS